jgi:group II intron reverse transcriptase/maturase
MTSDFNLTKSLLELVLERENLQRAFKQVKRNKGAPGIDGMTVEDLEDYLNRHWPTLRQSLIQGSYQPKPVRRVEIPKADGSTRALGIPTVVDRFIQQAIAQVVSKRWEPHFHPCSYGFRPLRCAHQAVKYMQELQRNKYEWVVDIDLKSFFDEVNQDRLMARLKSKIVDKPLLQLINRFLKAGILIDEVKVKSDKGVPQGGPLSPVLANIVLDELDWELESRGHKFARYADDCVILVRSQRAGERVMRSIQHFLQTTLKLKVNDQKSAVDRPSRRHFLGFTLSARDGRIKVSDKALSSLKDKVRTITRRTRGHSFSQIIAELKVTLLGWKAYFGIAEVVSPLREVDKWIRRKLRCYLWKQWGSRGYRQLRKLGIEVRLAWNTAKSAHGPWRLSNSPALTQGLPRKYFTRMGLPELAVR